MPCLRIGVLVVGLALLAFQHSTVSAGPGSKDPRAMFAVTMTEEFGEMLETAEKLDKRLDKGIQALLAAEEAGKRKSINKTTVEDLAGQLVTLSRIADTISVAREPSGEDIRRRADAHRITLTQIASRRSEEKDITKQLLRQKKDLTTKLKAAARKVPKIEKRFAKGQIRQALADHDALFHPLEKKMIWWHEGGWRANIMKDHDLLRKKFVKAISDKQIIELREKTSASVAELKPNRAKFIGAISDMANDVAKTGQTSFREKPLTGPEAMETMVGYWVTAQARLTRARAMAVLNMKQGGQLDYHDLEADQAALHLPVAMALVGLIHADTSRVEGEDARKLYFEYLDQITRVLAICSDPKIESAFESALRKLALKDAELARSESAYRAATDDLLRWRERTAQAYSAARRESFQPVDVAVTDAVQFRRQLATLLPKRDKKLVQSTLLYPAPDSIRDVQSFLLNKPVVTGSLIASGGNLFANGSTKTSTFAQSGVRNRCITYASVKKDAIQAAVDSLAADLFADQGGTPISLRANRALFSARHGDMVAVGGKVKRFGYLSWIGHFASVREGKRGAIRLQADEPEETLKDNTLVFQVLIKPEWLRHRYFFVKLDG